MFPEPNLAAMDLNLLVVFEALWVERNVTSAGRRLGLSQPATSGALARLREMLNDRLFIRGKHGLEPTDRCTELAGPLRKTLVELRGVVSGSTFSASTTTRHLRIGAVDAAIAVLMPKVLRRTMMEAPQAQVTVLSIDPSRATELLDDGQLDLAISPRVTPSATVRSRPLYDVDFVIAVRPGHPALKKKGANPLAAFPQVRVNFVGPPTGHAAARMSSFLAVPPVLLETDAWAALPGPFARPLEKQGLIKTLPAAVPHPKLQMRLLWPDAQDAAPASRWLRGIIAEVAGAL